MEKLFYGYYKPTEDQVSQIYKNGGIVLDTNALLDLYRYSQNARNEIFSALGLCGKRLWMPYQVGYEFHKNRLSVISAELKEVSNLESGVREAVKGFRVYLDRYKKNAEGSVQNLLIGIEGALNSFAEKISSELGLVGFDADPVLERVGKLFSGCVGSAPSADTLKKLKSDYQQRVSDGVPTPGEADKSKNRNKEGDYLIWWELIGFAKDKKKDVLFVTGDSKEDWWEIHLGKKIGIRSALAQEFYDETGCRIHLVSPELFGVKAVDYLSAKISSSTTEEMKTVSNYPAHAGHGISENVYRALAAAGVRPTNFDPMYSPYSSLDIFKNSNSSPFQEMLDEQARNHARLMSMFDEQTRSYAQLLDAFHLPVERASIEKEESENTKDPKKPSK